MNRPLLLVDVDGVISLFGFDPARPPGGNFLTVDGVAHYLSADVAGHLLELTEWFEPAWCTGWEEKANEYLPHALGLPGPWPYLEFTGPATAGSGHWKLEAVERYAGRRALAWIDDGHDERTRAWAEARGAPTLLICTEPPTGLTGQQSAALVEWAQGLAQGSTCVTGERPIKQPDDSRASDQARQDAERAVQREQNAGRKE